MVDENENVVNHDILSQSPDLNPHKHLWETLDCVRQTLTLFLGNIFWKRVIPCFSLSSVHEDGGAEKWRCSGADN